MPNPKSNERIKAEQIYNENKRTIKLTDIAQQLGVSPSKVRKWKTLDNWDGKTTAATDAKKKQVERSTSKKGNAPQKTAPPEKKKHGAPIGNKNAVGNSGGGAPYGSHNALTHGGYSKIYWDTLDDTEREMIEGVPYDEEELLINQIRLFDVRERRLMNALKKYGRLEETGGLAISGVRTFHTKREFDSEDEKERYLEIKQEKMDEDKISYFGYDKSTATDTEATINIIARLEKELSSVQRAKTQCISELNRVRRDKEETKGNSVADDWIKALIGGGEEDG